MDIPFVLQNHAAMVTFLKWQKLNGIVTFGVMPGISHCTKGIVAFSLHNKSCGVNNPADHQQSRFKSRGTHLVVMSVQFGIPFTAHRFKAVN